jgi:hypothetical protein
MNQRAAPPFQKLLKNCRSTVLPESFLTRSEGYTRNDMKLFSYPQC